VRTINEDARDQAVALVQFDKLMAEHAVTPHFQPIVALSTRDVEGYEVLARSRLFGLETPKEMFDVASLLNLEVELSVMLRWEGVQASLTMSEPPHLFLNTHPNEMDGSGLLASLQELRVAHPNQKFTLEIHESTVTDAARMAAIRPALTDLNIGLAYDDFGSGQSRLNEMSDGWLDYVKFDMSLIRDIHAAPPHRQQMVATLVQLVKNLGIRSVAEGVETVAENETCCQMGFDLGQGFWYGRPAPMRVT
jgi:EAL domain-containing protein (putative c-di-GMP-specific phosphodiesterase class I)